MQRAAWCSKGITLLMIVLLRLRLPQNCDFAVENLPSSHNCKFVTRAAALHAAVAADSAARVSTVVYTMIQRRLGVPALKSAPATAASTTHETG